MNAVDYDPVVLKAYAALLYQNASRLVLWTCVRWSIGGMLLGAMVAASTKSRAVDDALYQQGVSNASQGALFAVVILAVIFGLIGCWRGQARAWQMRLEAQRTLCQVQIEQNTRPPKAG